MTRESMKKAIQYDLNQKKRSEERKELYERFDRQILIIDICISI